MIGPAAAALASSTACIATASSWWAAVKRVQAKTSEQLPAPKALPVATAALVGAPAPDRDVEAAVIASGIFRKTSPERASALIKRMRLVRFPAGHVVFAQGDPGGALFMIVSGTVKVSYRHMDGREAVLNMLGATEVFGEVTPFDCGPREITATAMTEVLAVAIERHQLIAWMAEFPEVIHQIMRLLARRADVMTECLIDFACADPSYRVARRLLLLGKRFGRQDGEVVRVMHDLTVKEFSSFAGVPTETVAGILRDFTERGLIRFDDDALVIVDGQGLASLSEEVSCG